MTVHLLNEIEKLKNQILELGLRVEDSVREAVISFETRNTDIARKVIDSDNDVDTQEVSIEESCLQILALHQPVAIDLRLIVSCLKINNDLERIGDLAVNIAESALALAESKAPRYEFQLREMVDQAQPMLKSSLEALMRLDTDLAHRVIVSDEQVDRMLKEMFNRAHVSIREHPDQTRFVLRYLSVARQLERIADLATNICEDVVYLVEGVIIRHHLSPLFSDRQSTFSAQPKS